MPDSASSVAAFLAAPGPLLDVRAPVEYAEGHIPGAVSLPLFSDEERARIGTTYKRINPEQAVLLGLDYFGPKMSRMVREVRKLAPGGTVRVHCWRGGMRSGAVSWLLELAGFQVLKLEGGYKAYRRACLAEFGQPRALRVLGGLTGSGKTEVLQVLARQGAPVLDLEALARHKGSAFGAIGQPAQPTQEQFENELAAALGGFDPATPLWLEDESRCLGAVSLPAPFYDQLRAAPLSVLRVPRAARVQKLTLEYGRQDPQLLALAVLRIGKRLGGLATKEALGAIVNGEMSRMVELVLDYYDKTYGWGLEGRPAPLTWVEAEDGNPQLNAALLGPVSAPVSG